MTPKKGWESTFFDALRGSANVIAACVAAGISRKTVYEHRQRSDEFRAEWADALEEGCDVLEAEARRRAVDGVDEPVVYQGKWQGVWVNAEGKRVGEEAEGAVHIPLTIKKYSDTLLIFLLKGARPEKYRERFQMSGDKDQPLVVTMVDPRLPPQAVPR